MPYPGYTVDEWNDVLNSMRDAANKLTQNDINFLCKTYQIWHDFFFGEGNNDVDLEQIQPFTFSATCCINSDNRAYGGHGVTINGYSQQQAHLIFPVVFDGYNLTYGACKPVYANAQLNQTSEQGQINLADFMSQCNETAAGTLLTCDRKNSSLTPFYNDRCLASFPNYQNLTYLMPCAYQAYGMVEQPYYSTSQTKALFKLWNNSLVYGNSTNLTTRLTETIEIDFKNVGYIDENSTASSGYFKNFGSGSIQSNSDTWLLRPFVGAQGSALVTNVSPDNISQTLIDKYISTGTYNETATYITNNGDTINITYGDNFISTGIGNTPVSYDDLYNILNIIGDDLNINGNLVDGDGNSYTITVPTLDQIRYVDMGDFNITPIQQIKELPVAPDIEEITVDPTDYFDMLGHSISGFMGIVDGLGLTAMLAFTVIAVFIINKLRGD